MTVTKGNCTLPTSLVQKVGKMTRQKVFSGGTQLVPNTYFEKTAGHFLQNRRIINSDMQSINYCPLKSSIFLRHGQIVTEKIETSNWMVRVDQRYKPKTININNILNYIQIGLKENNQLSLAVLNEDIFSLCWAY